MGHDQGPGPPYRLGTGILFHPLVVSLQALISGRALDASELEATKSNLAGWRPSGGRATPGTETEPWSGHLEAFVVLAAAVVLAALLQLVVFLPPGSVSWHWTIGVIAVGFGLVAFIFLGGWDWAAGRLEEWSIRRHIRKHPDLVNDLISLLDQHGQVFGSGNWFLNSGNSVMQNWLAASLQNPCPFTPQQKESGNQAHAQLMAWSNASVYWSYLKSVLEWRIKHRAFVDSYEFYWAAKMVGVEISRGLLSASNFVNAIRNAGVDRLPNYNSDRWDDFRNRADEVVRLAHEINRRGELELGLKLDLNFQFVPPLYPRPGDPPPTAAPRMGEVQPPVESPASAPPPTPTATGQSAR
ncbi:MAG TPA: hypothetical protein VFF67_07845 [Thermoplasmata archaeon]|nr:hypothetical protein [Thermoplasmata archaeon]